MLDDQMRPYPTKPRWEAEYERWAYLHECGEGESDEAKEIAARFKATMEGLIKFDEQMRKMVESMRTPRPPRPGSPGPL